MQRIAGRIARTSRGCLLLVATLLCTLTANAILASDDEVTEGDQVAAQVSPLDDPAAVELFVDGVVGPLMKNNNSPSGTVAIMRGGEMLLAKGYGYEDIDEQTPAVAERTLFRPGSVSKLFTWVAVMQQVEQGKLDLDADVNTYLETFQIKEAFGEPITLRHIMTHTPGFEEGGMGYLIISDPERSYPLAEAMARFQPKRVNPPGAQTSYSNYGTALAGLIVANVSGLSFNDAIEQKIFQPLGMSSSSFVEPLPAHLDERMATSYSPEGGHFVEKPFEIIASFGPAGALSSTSTDMVRFAQAILNGGELDGNRILEEATVEEMLTRNFSHDDRLMGMALGFYESDYNGFRVLGHGGDTAWFHSELGIDQENDLVFFASFGGPGGGTVRSSLFPAFYDEFFPREEAPPAPPEGFQERAGRYAGTYSFWRSNFSTIEKALGLTTAIQVAGTADDTLAISFAGATKQYAEVEDNLFRELSPGLGLGGGLSPRLLAFQENDAGAVTGFVIDGLPFMSLRKLAFYETPNFNLTLLVVSLIVLAMVVFRRFFQRKAIAEMSQPDRSALSSAFYAAAANLAVVVALAIVLGAVGNRLSGEIPLLFKLWLLLPIVATLAGLYLLFRTVGVWREKLLANHWARARFSVVAASALFMCWFYFFWNMLGFQYKT